MQPKTICPFCRREYTVRPLARGDDLPPCYIVRRHGNPLCLGAYAVVEAHDVKFPVGTKEKRNR